MTREDLIRFGNSPLAHTYSIVARDPGSGELGVAVESQALVEPSYGKLGLDLMRAGKSAPDALGGLVSSDPMNNIRQVAMVDAEGRVAAHTGSLTIAEAGHVTGEGFSVQANMMLRATVWPVMAEAYKSARGELVDRLMAALDAAEAEGGDIRGRQSAAILIVSGENTGKPWSDKVYDVRVDDAPEPLKEIRRLVLVARAYSHMRAALSATQRGDFDTHNREFEKASNLLRDNPEMRFWHGIGLLNSGKIEQGMTILGEVAARDRNWATLALRLPPFMLSADSATRERIRQLA